MAFDAVGYSIAFAITRDPRLSLIGGLMGRNPAGVVLVAALANQGRLGGAPTLPPGQRPSVPRLVQVPSVGDDPEEARKAIEGRGLVATTERVASDEPMDGVIDTDPEAETVVPVGSTVAIRVSAGLTVPDVTGKKYEDAEKMVKDAGFSEVARSESEKVGTPEVVERQNPEGGTPADSTSTVTLYVFKARELKDASSDG